MRPALLGVALATKPARVGFHQPRILRAVRFVALLATVASPTCHRIVLEGERPRYLRVARHALLFRHTDQLLRGGAWMKRVTVGAHHPALWNGVVGRLAEFGHLGFVALAAKRRLVGLQQLARRLGRGEDRLLNQTSVARCRRRLIFRVDRVARNAGNVGPRMGRSAPMRRLHQIAVAPETCVRNLFGRDLRIGDDLRIVVPRMNRAGTVASFAALPIHRQLGVLHERRMAGLVELVDFFLVALRALLVAKKVRWLCLGKQLLRKARRFMGSLVRGARKQR